jgi:SAM-dependent methyltransferase
MAAHVDSRVTSGPGGNGPKMSEPSSQHQQQITAALTGPHGDDLMRLMHDTASNQPTNGLPGAARDLARGLGWIDGAGRLTALGFRASDPLREYVNWESRGRTFTYSEHFPLLSPPLFAGKRLVEIGSGFGVNLISIDGVARWSVGVDRDPYRLGFADFLANRAGRKKPNLVIGDAGAVPLGDRIADLVMVIGALQYMPFRKVFAEAARMLVPGGLLVFVNSDLSGHLVDLARGLSRTVRHPRDLARETMLVARMLLYPYLGPAAIRSGDPAFLPRRITRLWLKQAGFRVDDERTTLSDIERCWVAVRE